MSDHSAPSTRLLMIGAAAVVSIYATGYARTQAAADRLAEEDAAHQRAAPVERIPLPSADTVRAVSAVAAAARETVVTPPAVAVAPRAAAARTAAPAAMTKDSPAAATKDTVAAVVVAPAPAPAPAPDSTVAKATPAAPRWRDGTFSGWGNSRHGSIEATVTIKNGKITDAYISRCETRYSCSWIEHLQIQVVDRQSPEVDFVSGATQSVNAFYYAVVEALLAAKAP